MTQTAIVNFMKEAVDAGIQGEIAQASINGEVSCLSYSEI